MANKMVKLTKENIGRAGTISFIACMILNPLVFPKEIFLIPLTLWIIYIALDAK